MIVPISKSTTTAPTAYAQMPSETNLLMALGAMHKNGYFGQDSKVPKIKPLSVGEK